MEKLITGLKELVGKDDIEQVFNLLQESLNNRSTDKFDQFIIIKSKYIHLQKRMGIVKEDESKRERIVIKDNLLSFVNTLTPVDFQQSFKEVYASSSKEINSLRNKLEEKNKIIRNLEIINNENHLIINSPLHRTKLITESLENLLENSSVDPRKTIIWSISFLSIFAFSQEEAESNPRLSLGEALLREQDALLALARNGIKINCLITPASPYMLIKNSVPTAYLRTKKLLSFLHSDHEGLRNINWAVSEYDTENRYIIGDDAMFVGFKKGSNISYGMTKLIDDQDVINIKIRFYEDFFADLAAHTLFKWGKEKNIEMSNSNNINRNYLLREATINCLKESLRYLESKM